MKIVLNLYYDGFCLSKLGALLLIMHKRKNGCDVSALMESFTTTVNYYILYPERNINSYLLDIPRNDPDLIYLVEKYPDTIDEVHIRKDMHSSSNSPIENKIKIGGPFTKFRVVEIADRYCKNYEIRNWGDFELLYIKLEDGTFHSVYHPYDMLYQMRISKEVAKVKTKIIEDVSEVKIKIKEEVSKMKLEINEITKIKRKLKRRLKSKKMKN